MVTRTTLETNSASLLYLVASIDELAAAGIAETKITTDLCTPVRLKRLTVKIPNSKPIPILRKEATNVVGSEVIFTLDMLKPRTSKTDSRSR